MSPRPQKVTDDEVFVAAHRAMARLGPAELTLAHIADEAGLTAGALVQRFGSKRDLLLRLMERFSGGSSGTFAELRRRHRSPLAVLRAYGECMADMASTPAALLRNDPMYTSVFVANLGSIELDAAYHHLYEWGNCPLFATLGRIEKDGDRTVAIVKFSYDERVEDGLYAARSLEKFRAYAEDPAAWVDLDDVTP